jgi:hypothetical protein
MAVLADFFILRLENAASAVSLPIPYVLPISHIYSILYLKIRLLVKLQNISKQHPIL